MRAVTDGAEYYGQTISEGHSQTFGDINSTAQDIENNAKNLDDKVESIKETPLTAVFFIPAAIIDALKLSANYFSYFLDIYTALNDVLGIPRYIMVSFEIALLLLISYLIIDAFMRYKNT